MVVFRDGRALRGDGYNPVKDVCSYGYDVLGLTASLTDGWTIGKNFGHLAHGYAVTSQAAQGKTVDRVFVGISSMSFSAASREGFYVACSRVREMASIYTDEKAALLEAVSQMDDRLGATEFMAARENRERDDSSCRMDRQWQVGRDMAQRTKDREAMTYER